MAGPRSYQLSPKQRSLLRAMLDESPGADRPDAPDAPGVVGAAAGTRAGAGVDVAPLSFAQERMWFLDQYETDQPIYNMPMAQDLPVPVDLRAVRQAVDELVRRQASLRTTFPLIDGRPAQAVAPAAPVPLPVVDLAGRTDRSADELLDDLVAAERHTPFDLASGPLFRASLVQLPGPRAAVLLNMHHIVSDGWSTGILLGELQALYAAYAAGRPPPLPEPSLQYVDHARRQRRELSGEALDALLAYWSHQLDGAPPTLDLPTDRPRPRHQTFRGETLLFSVPDAVARRLAALSASSGATLFMTLLAAFDVLLHRMTGQEDVVVGTPIASRNRADIEGVIGLFANTLILRTDVSGDPRFVDLLDRVRSVAIGAYAHQELPFEKLVSELQPERALSHGPLFQVMFALQNTPTTGRRELDGTYDAPDEVVVGDTPARFDLALFLGEADRGLAAELEYNVDLFDRATAQRVARHYRTLLGSIAERPEARLSELTILDEGERRAVLDIGRGPAPGPPAVDGVHQYVERQARERPGAAAVVHGDRTLSYGELDDRAGRLARGLRRLGVGVGDRVAIHLPRSIENVVAVLGALKAGAAYVPLDPGYPPDRLAYMVDDADVAALVTLDAWRDRLPVDRPTLTVDSLLDEEADEAGGDDAAGAADGAADGFAEADDLAYVIYTSGSTGRPKGVAMPHSALVNLVAWHEPEDGPAPRTLQFAALGFDVSFQETFATLGWGGTLVLLDDDERLDFDRLLARVDALGVERLFLPPAALAAIAALPSAAEAGPSTVDEVICAGEQLVVTDAVAALLERIGARLSNHYGPTETHVATALTLDGPPATWPARPSIGRPIAGSLAYVLDPADRPAPVGIPGDLALGGLALARGYLDRPDLTRQRFVPDPFAPGGRVFLTGDRARWLPDGTLEFLGRDDDQVKVRGFRVELGEVDAVLAEHPAVREAAVAAHRDANGQLRLAAYVVTHEEGGGAEFTGELTRELIEFLAARLPGYMVPGAVVRLDALPLSPNGKVDRRHLPAPGTGPGDRAPGLAPRSPLEKEIADLWRTVLGLDHLGVDDEFFDLGGHSLLATQVVSHLRHDMGVDVPLRRLFEPPSTVASLARAVVESRLAAAGPPAARAALEAVEAMTDGDVAAELGAAAHG